MKPEDLRDLSGRYSRKDMESKRRSSRKRQCSSIRRIECPDGMVFVNLLAEHRRFINYLVYEFDIKTIETFPISPFTRRENFFAGECVVPIKFALGSVEYRFYDTNIRQDIRFYGDLEIIKKMQERVAEYSASREKRA